MTEIIPWCEKCECYSVPTDKEKCGVCGCKITYKKRLE